MRRDVAKTKRCSVTKKVSYRDDESAARALRNISRSVDAGDLDDTGKLPHRYYPCGFCGHFHLTSKEEE